MDRRDRRERSVGDAMLRLVLGIGQMALAAGAAAALATGAPGEVTLALTVAASALTAVSVRRWGGFWRRDRGR